MQESRPIVFLVRVQCRRKESSRSLSHLLMSFLLPVAVMICATLVNTQTHTDRQLLTGCTISSASCVKKAGLNISQRASNPENYTLPY